MAIVIDDNLLTDLRLSENELKLEIAIMLFSINRFTLGKAAEFCELHKHELQLELAKRKIPLHYDIDMFNEDLKTIETLR